MIYGTDYQNYGVYYNHNILNTIVGSDMKSLLSLQYNNIIQNHNYSSLFGLGKKLVGSDLMHWPF